MSRTDCPTADQLRAFQVGDLTEDELDLVGEHLEVCSDCEAAVQALDGLTDPGMTPFRNSARLAATHEEAVPTRIGDYEILGEAARGGMGIVYRARHVVLNRIVALKMLRGAEFADREERRRFRAEAEAVAELQHPHIIQIFDIGEWSSGPSGTPIPYFVLEFVEGGSLSSHTGGRPQTPEQAAAWLEPLAEAIHFAHQRGIVHRDLKPSNVLLTADGQPRLCDFGVAKRLRPSAEATRSGYLIGTAEYMAPEQAEGRSTVGPPADIYALGALLYTLLTGRPPLQGASPIETLQQVRTQEPVSPRRLQPAIPLDLETICLKCLQKNPQHRYPSARALADDLGRYRSGEPIHARPVGLAERTIKWSRRRPALAGLSAALLLVTLVGIGGILWQLVRVEAARADAVQARDIADGERGKAVQLAEDLRLQRDAAEWNGYRANLAAASSALRLHNNLVARRALDAAPERHRNWEWYHFAGQLDRSLAILRTSAGGVYSVAFAPEGKSLATGEADGTVRIWDPASGQPIVQHRPHASRVFFVAWGGGGTRLASGSVDGAVHLWDNEAKSAIFHLPASGVPPNYLAFSPGGQRLGFNTQDGRIWVWEAATGMEVLKLGAHPARRLLAFSPDGQRIAISEGDHQVQLRDLASGQIVTRLRASTSHSLEGLFSPDGQRFVARGVAASRTVDLWSVSDSRLLAVLRGHGDEIRSLALSPDGTRIATGSMDKTARLWDARTGQFLASLQGHIGLVHTVRFSPSGGPLVTVGEDRTIRLWNGVSGASISVLTGHADIVPSVEFRHDGQRLASASFDGTVRLWDVAQAQRNGVFRGHGGWVFDVAFTPNGEEVVSAAWDARVSIWDARTGAEKRELRHPQPFLTSLSLSPDGQRLVSLVRYGTEVFLWDVATGKLLRRMAYPPGFSAEMRCGFCPDGKLIAAAGRQGQVDLWDADTGQHLGQLRGHTDRVLNLAFSPDGSRLISTGADARIRVWDLATRQSLATLSGHTVPATSVAYRADGRMFASGGPDRTVRLWDALTFAERKVLPTGLLVSAVRFHPDGTRLATACSDHTIHLWDVDKGEEVAELHGHEDYIQALAFSKDGGRLASCGNDGTVRVWQSIPTQTLR